MAESPAFSELHRSMLAAAELIGRVYIEPAWREERRACAQLVDAGLLEEPYCEDGCSVYALTAAGRGAVRRAS